MIIIIIALKGPVRDFFTISSLCHKLSPTRPLKWPGCNHVQIICNTLSAYHVQHIECLSCATCWALIMCNTLRAYHVQHIERLSCATHWALIMCNTLSAYHVQHIERLSCATHWALIMCNTLSAYHVQHIECLSCATHWVLIMCNMLSATWYEGQFSLQVWQCCKSHLFQFYFIGWTINRWRRGGNQSTWERPPDNEL